MTLDLSRPETFLISFSDRGDRFAVAVKARDEASARLAFAGMSTAQRRARIVARLSAPESDQMARFTDWLAGLLSRRRRAA